MPKETNIIHGEDGSAIIEYADGSVEYSNADGSGKWIGPDKSVSKWDKNGKNLSWDKNTGIDSDTVLAFPIKTDTACQLKWSHSTVYLTNNTTASCHRVDHDTIPNDFDFHNTPEKLKARKLMLEGKWPGKGCEYCSTVEDAGGFSDRLQHLTYPNLAAPHELDTDPNAIQVTPRWLEIYFSNLCNLACLYCNSSFSSVWENEQLKFEPNFKRNPMTKELQYTEEMFLWLDKNVHYLYNLMVLGGEPFTQPQSDRLLEFLKGHKCPNLTLTFFSNLSVDAGKLKKRFQKMQALKDNGNIKEVHVVASIDCWGAQAEYIRSGLKLDLFEKNFLFLLTNTTCRLNINMTGSSLSVASMPDLIKKVNQWNQVRRVYLSMMLVSGSGSFAEDNSNDKALSMVIFGRDIVNKGFKQSIDMLETHNDVELINFKKHMNGLMDTIATFDENIKEQQKLHKFLTKMDKRRNTSYKTLFPDIYNKISKILP